MAALAQSTDHLVFAGPGDPFNPHARGETETLFSTLAGITNSPNSITSQFFPDQGPKANRYFTIGVDDFIIPEGERWIIEEVRVVGNFTDNGSPQGMNLFVLASNGAGTQPDTIDIFNDADPNVLFLGEGLPFTDADFGDFVIALDAPLILDAGRYFVGVQPIMDSSLFGQWLWTESASAPNSGMTIGNESAWMENFDILGNGACVNQWGARVTDCAITDPDDVSVPERDLAFEIGGSRVTPGITRNAPALLTTSEAGGETSFTLVLDGIPTETVNIQMTSLQPGEAQLVVGEDPLGVTATVSFDTNNWDQEQTVRVVGMDDPFIDPGGPFVVTFAVVTDDLLYASFTLDDLPGGNLDDFCDIFRHDNAVDADASMPSASSNAGRLAYLSTADPLGTNGDGSTEIFLFDTTTLLQQQITNTADRFFSRPFLSGDGLRLTFSSDADLTGQNAAGRVEVFLYELGTFTQITQTTDVNGALAAGISEDGGTLALLSADDLDGANGDGSREAYLYDIAGQSFTQVSVGPANEPTEDVGELIVHRDGEAATYLRGDPADLFQWHRGVGTGNLIRTGHHTRIDGTRDGRRISFISSDNIDNNNPEMNAELYVVDFLSAKRGLPITQVTSSASATVEDAAINNRGLLGFVADGFDPVGTNGDLGKEFFITQMGSGTFEQVTEFADNQATQARFEGIDLGADAKQLIYSFNQDLRQRVFLEGVRPGFMLAVAAWRGEETNTVLTLMPMLCEPAN
ncbi:TolB family protein [Sulfidibacter corallicola]|uniref:Uncharacterized protein n=1 Tax=Sulfidibacter corallicola TaxID=2818388 RepID=A0A8A4TJH6_SULCO|nr:hypothetical protein [Sulfidibacter corallicola]QTD48948.1 hypothetical protein J3U87_25470 [Sulfidibacter corallicola]